ncbi:MAG: TIM barrel protein [Balneolales bacterium]
MNRRKFIKHTGIAGSLAPFAISPAFSFGVKAPELEVHVFSKHLHFLDYAEMARTAADLGFDGVDLTVRPDGHVVPEQVQRDLPKAIEAIRNEKLLHRMITTAVDDAHDETDRQVLKTAAELGIEYYRMNWLRYDDQRSMPESMKTFQSRIHELGALSSQLGIIGCYQNHAGTMAGAALWEVHQMLEDAKPAGMGVQYDIRHATVEGGLSWENGLQLVQPRIRTLVLKDFKWEKKNGRWDLINTPIGEGMVDFTRYFRLLKKYEINVPVSVHFEYPLGGAEHGSRELSVSKSEVFHAMEKDLNTIRSLWRSVH